MSDDPILYRTESRFSAIYVIESLPPGDLKTGRDLFDSVVYPATCSLGVHAQFFSVNTTADLAASLAEIARGIHLQGRLPIVHIEAHGTGDGIALADGTVVNWSELVPLFGDINRASRMNLTVVAIACMGWSLMQALVPVGRAPFFMLVAPPGVMTAGDLLTATQDFYAALFAKLDVNEALEAMNGGTPFDSWRIRPATAEIYFCRMFRHFISNGGTFEEDSAVENTLVSEAIARGGGADDEAAVRELVRQQLADPRWRYEWQRRVYLWMDVYPEYASRFGMTYDRCWGNNPENPSARVPNVALRVTKELL